MGGTSFHNVSQIRADTEHFVEDLKDVSKRLTLRVSESPDTELRSLVERLATLLG